jgi:hypothetical protein
MTIAFQPDAFQLGYPTQDVAFQGVVRYVQVGLTFVRPMWQVRRGDGVILGCETYDPGLLPQIKFTPQTVQLSLYKPDGTVQLNQVGLVPTSPGEHIYRHQTLVTDPLGVYLVEFRAVNVSYTSYLSRQAAFRLVDP